MSRHLREAKPNQLCVTSINLLPLPDNQVELYRDLQPVSSGLGHRPSPSGFIINSSWTRYWNYSEPLTIIQTFLELRSTTKLLVSLLRRDQKLYVLQQGSECALELGAEAEGRWTS